jgi:hypothetical protein
VSLAGGSAELGSACLDIVGISSGATCLEVSSICWSAEVASACLDIEGIGSAVNCLEVSSVCLSAGAGAGADCSDNVGICSAIATLPAVPAGFHGL